MNITAEGTITKVLPIKYGTKKDGTPFQTQDFVLTDLNARYEESICFTVYGEARIQEFAPKLALNSKVVVHIAPSTRTSVNQQTGEERAYCSLTAWRVENPAYDAHAAQLAAKIQESQAVYQQQPIPPTPQYQAQAPQAIPTPQPQATPAPQQQAIPQPQAMPQQPQPGDLPF